MKKLLLAIISLTSFVAFAQKDIECTLNTPSTGTVIYAGQPINIGFTIKSVGATDIPATDTIFFGLIVGNQVLTSALINHGGFTANQSKSFNINNLTLTFSANSYNVNLCGLAVLRFVTILDNNTTNNSSCNSVNFNTTVGIEEEIALAQSVKAYPNPANSTFTITLKSSDASVDIMDITGKMIEKAAVTLGEARFNVSNYSNGVYFYQVKNESNKVIKSGKFTVAH